MDGQEWTSSCRTRRDGSVGALSFWLESANRVAMGLMASRNEDRPEFYLVRLLAYGLILLAIWQKNRPSR